MTTSPRQPATPTDVTVVGAGPTGLLLAGDLAAAQVRVTLLERRAQESNLTRAFAVHARTLEQLDARDLADELVATGNAVTRLRLFGAISVDLATLPSRFAYVLITPQYHVESLLERRATRLGAVIVRGAHVDAVRQDDQGVEATYHDPAGEATTVRASYLVGTDGHRSTVREALGLDFPGESVVRSLMLADVLLEDPPAQVLTVDGNAEGFCFVVPYGDGWHRVIARDPNRELPDDVPVTLEEIAGVARRVFGTDFGMHSPRWMSRFHSDERQVRRYRVGRVFLAGDAAHVHSPAGGMGMNTGLQDAANLGWKLAAAVHGRGGDRLLDSYHDERRPVGRRVLRASGGLVRGAMLRPPAARALRNVVARTALRVPAVGDRLRGLVSGIGIAYPPAAGDHRLVGSRAVDVHGSDGRRLHEVLRAGRFVLVAPPGFGADRLADLDGVEGKVEVLTDAARTTSLLVRPDGYVGWAGDTREGLRDAMRRWGLATDQTPRA